MPDNSLSRRNVLLYAAATGVGITGVGRAAAAEANAAPAAGGSRAAGPLDTLGFGDETAHGLTATLSDMVAKGGLGQSARVLRPTDPATFWGGTLSFTEGDGKGVIR